MVMHCVTLQLKYMHALPTVWAHAPKLRSDNIYLVMAGSNTITEQQLYYHATIYLFIGTYNVHLQLKTLKWCRTIVMEEA